MVYERTCPSCKKTQNFTSELGYLNALSKKSVCRSCSKSGNKNPSFGISPSKTWRDKISESNTGQKRSEKTRQLLSSIGKTRLGEKNNFYGRTHTSESKTKSSISQHGEKSYWFGKPKSENTRQKMRVAKLQLLKESGVLPCIDRGAREYFDKLNVDGYNIIHPFYNFDIGYIADGYDPEKHMWFEFDTPYHNRMGQQLKDEQRQNNIINYYKNINKPLAKFVRIISEGLVWKEFV